MPSAPGMLSISEMPKLGDGKPPGLLSTAHQLMFLIARVADARRARLHSLDQSTCLTLTHPEWDPKSARQDALL